MQRDLSKSQRHSRQPEGNFESEMLVKYSFSFIFDGQNISFQNQVSSVLLCLYFTKGCDKRLDSIISLRLGLVMVCGPSLSFIRMIKVWHLAKPDLTKVTVNGCVSTDLREHISTFMRSLFDESPMFGYIRTWDEKIPLLHITVCDTSPAQRDMTSALICSRHHHPQLISSSRDKFLRATKREENILQFMILSNVLQL